MKILVFLGLFFEAALRILATLFLLIISFLLLFNFIGWKWFIDNLSLITVISISIVLSMLILDRYIKLDKIERLIKKNITVDYLEDSDRVRRTLEEMVGKTKDIMFIIGSKSMFEPYLKLISQKVSMSEVTYYSLNFAHLQPNSRELDDQKMSRTG
jgi:hypothetical protein